MKFWLTIFFLLVVTYSKGQIEKKIYIGFDFIFKENLLNKHKLSCFGKFRDDSIHVNNQYADLIGLLSARNILNLNDSVIFDYGMRNREMKKIQLDSLNFIYNKLKFINENDYKVDIGEYKLYTYNKMRRNLKRRPYFLKISEVFVVEDSGLSCVEFRFTRGNYCESLGLLFVFNENDEVIKYYNYKISRSTFENYDEQFSR